MKQMEAINNSMDKHLRRERKEERRERKRYKNVVQRIGKRRVQIQSPSCHSHNYMHRYHHHEGSPCRCVPQSPLAQFHTSFQQTRLQMPNIIFVNLFNWFVKKYGTTMPKDCYLNCQRMAIDWHLLEGFDALTLHLFTSGVYSNACSYPIPACDIIDIDICIIKRCGLYAEECKQ